MIGHIVIGSAILLMLKHSLYLQEHIPLEGYKKVYDMDYEHINLTPYQLLVGFDMWGDIIVADMKETPHILVTGLTGQGKTGCIRTMLKNLKENDNADTILLNAFSDDFRGFSIRNIKSHADIKSYLEKLLEGIEEGINRERPLYIIFEELGKIKDKDLIALTTKILQYGRHSNIFLIGVIQTATKEELRFKSLFNARLTFKQIDEASYRVVLGCGVEKKLQKRDFYLYTNDLYKGKTYNLEF